MGIPFNGYTRGAGRTQMFAKSQVDTAIAGGKVWNNTARYAMRANDTIFGMAHGNAGDGKRQFTNAETPGAFVIVRKHGYKRRFYVVMLLDGWKASHIVGDRYFKSPQQAEKWAQGEYRNAHRTTRSALLNVLAVEDKKQGPWEVIE